MYSPTPSPKTDKASKNSSVFLRGYSDLDEETIYPYNTNIQTQIQTNVHLRSTNTESNLSNNNDTNITYSRSSIANTKVNPQRCSSFIIKNNNIALAIMASCALMQNILVGGANNAILTTIERAYFMTSLESAMFLAFYDIANIISSPIIGFFGDRVYKPRILALSMVGLSLGAFIMVLPEFIAMDSMNSNSLSSNSTDNNGNQALCVSSIITNSTTLTLPTTSAMTTKSPKDSSNQLLNNMKYFFYLANIINGISSVALYTIAISFIENIFLKEQVNVRQGVYYAIGAIGVGVGMLATGNFLNINGVLKFKSNSAKMNSNSINWIGAWWIIYLIGVFCNLILSVLLCCFSPSLILKRNQATKTESLDATGPVQNESLISTVKSLPLSDSATATTSSDLNSMTTLPSVLDLQTPPTQKEHMRDFIKNTKLILSNRVYMLIVTCTLCETFLIKGFSSYLTKYLEYQYRLSASTSTMIAGTIGFISLVFGTLSGALLVKRFKWTMKQCCKFVTINLFFTSFLFLGLLIYCPQEKYINSENELYQNSTCKCDVNIFYPICYNNDFIFQTPCHAGCENFETPLNYSECRVLDLLLKNRNVSERTLIPCPRPDKNCIGHLVLVSVAGLGILFLSSIVILPLLRIILESIGPENQSFALGIRSLLTKLFGNIPGPIVFATAVDKSCLQWTSRALTGSKTCRLYDNKLFSKSLSILGFSMRFCSGCFALATLFFIFKMKKLEISDQDGAIVTTKEQSGKRVANETTGRINTAYESDERDHFQNV